MYYSFSIPVEICLISVEGSLWFVYFLKLYLVLLFSRWYEYNFLIFLICTRGISTFHVWLKFTSPSQHGNSVNLISVHISQHITEAKYKSLFFFKINLLYDSIFDNRLQFPGQSSFFLQKSLQYFCSQI